MTKNKLYNIAKNFVLYSRSEGAEIAQAILSNTFMASEKSQGGLSRLYKPTGNTEAGTKGKQEDVQVVLTAFVMEEIHVASFGI